MKPAEMKTRPARVALEPSRSSIISMIYSHQSHAERQRGGAHLDDVPDLLAELRLRGRGNDDAQERSDTESDRHGDELRPDGGAGLLGARSKVGGVGDKREHVAGRQLQPRLES